MAARSYVDLRPNLLGFTLAASMILTLALARRNVPWIWASVAVSTLWANTHGSFIFGLGMMGLWTVCALLASLAEHGPAEAARRFWPLPAATLAATLLAGTVTPFGLENLIHPFTVARHPIWRRVTEWWPIFQAGENPFGSLWEFFTFLAVLAVLVGIHAFRRAGSPRRTRRRWAPSDLAGIAFDAALSIVVIAMAFGARRFIPQAMVVVAPVVMVLLDPILRIRPVWPTALLAVALAGPTAVVCARLVPHYLAGNPLYAHEDRSFFARMIRQELFPSDLAEFVRANGIEGRVLNEWRWEGYLRWQVPRLKLYVGGRAQQVYAPETYRLWLDLLEGRAPTAVLPRSEVALVIGPTRGPFRKLLDRLVHEPEPRWVYVYCDTRGAVLADVRSDATRALVEKSRSGALTYPDPSIGRISRAMFLSSPAAGAPPQQAVLSLLAAGRERPTPILYEALVKLAQSGSVSPQWVLEQLEAERTRLASLPAGQGDYVKILSSRSLIDQLLAQVYRASSDPAERQRSSDLLEEARGLSEEVRRVTVKE